MKRIIYYSIGYLLALSMVSYAWAAGIQNTKHNLSSTGTNIIKGSTNEICIYCHTPHHAATGVTAPLWNRVASTATYTMYSGTGTGGNFDATIDAAPSGVSAACLSCHDGTVGINQLLNNQGSGLGANPANLTDPKLTGAVLLGIDLSNDHPISMIYSTAKSPSSSSGTNDHVTGFNDPTAGNYFANGVKLDDAGKVQCASCHDPHRSDTPTFLRVANAPNSALCLTCHKKNL